MLKNDKRFIFSRPGTRSAPSRRRSPPTGCSRRSTSQGRGELHRHRRAMPLLRTAGYLVQCDVLERDADPVGIGGAENAVRIAMDPADQFEASARLSKREQACRILPPRCGVSETLAEKRVKLGRTGPARTRCAVPFVEMSEAKSRSRALGTADSIIEFYQSLTSRSLKLCPRIHPHSLATMFIRFAASARLTRSELAERTGLKQQYISLIESGVTLETAALIASALGCELWAMLKGPSHRAISRTRCPAPVGGNAVRVER